MAEADDPERAVQPYDGSRLGRAGHKLQVSLGTLGEAIDSRVAKRRGLAGAAQPAVDLFEVRRLGHQLPPAR